MRLDKYRIICVLFHWQISQVYLEPTVLHKGNDLELQNDGS